MYSNPDEPDQRPLEVRELTDLARLPVLAPGQQVRVRANGELVHATGSVSSAVARVLGWPDVNVWLRHAERMQIEARLRIFPDVVATIAAILAEPSSVHLDRRAPHATYFLIDAERLRQRGLLTSRSIQLVDLVVQSHGPTDATLLRAFHLAPTRRNRGGPQLWP